LAFRHADKITPNGLGLVVVYTAVMLQRDKDINRQTTRSLGIPTSTLSRERTNDRICVNFLHLDIAVLTDSRGISVRLLHMPSAIFRVIARIFQMCDMLAMQ